MTTTALRPKASKKKLRRLKKMRRRLEKFHRWMLQSTEDTATSRALAGAAMKMLDAVEKSLQEEKAK